MRGAVGCTLAVLLLSVVAALLPPIIFRGRKSVAVRSELSLIESLLDEYKLFRRRYPTTSEGLIVLSDPTDGKRRLSLQSVTRDPWGNPYVYESDGRSYRLMSFGADGKPGGKGDDADVTVSD